MPVDYRLRRRVILIETCRGHRLLDLSDGSLCVGNLRFELLDLLSPRLIGPHTVSVLRSGARLRFP